MKIRQIDEIRAEAKKEGEVVDAAYRFGYNQAIDKALEVVRKHWGSSLIISDIQALKKNQQ